MIVRMNQYIVYAWHEHHKQRALTGNNQENGP